MIFNCLKENRIVNENGRRIYNSPAVFLVLYRHRADVLEDQVAPDGVSGVLVAAVAVFVLLEEGFSVRGEGNEAAGGELVESITFHGVDDSLRVPHLLAGVAVEELVGPLDRVEVCPVHIADDSFRAVIQRVSYFSRGKDDVHVLWPELEELEGEVDGGLEVVVRFNGIVEDTAHCVKGADLLSDEFYAGEVGVFIGAGLEEAGEGGYKADGGDGDGFIRGLGQELAVEFVGFRVGAGVSNGALEHRLCLCGAGVWEVVVGDEDVRVRDAAGFQADRDVGISVEVVHYVCNVCVGTVHAVHNDADQVAAFHIHIAV